MSIFRKTILFVVTLAFLFESADVLVSIDLYVHRYIEQEKAEQSNAKDLMRFTFSNNVFSSLTWTDGKNEFELNNKRFDVASIKYLFNRVVVFAKSDSKEDMLLSLLHNFHKNASKNIRLLKFHKNDMPSNAFFVYYGVINSVETRYYFRSVYSEPIIFFSPPPNCC